WVAAKYTTAGACIVLGARYRPLQRCFASRSAIAPLGSWARRQQLRLREAVKPDFGDAHGGVGRLRSALNAARSRYRAAGQSALETADRWKAAGKDRWKAAGRRAPPNRQMLQHQRRALQRLQEERRLLRQYGWYVWSSEKYWHFSDKFRASAERSPIWSWLTRALGSNNPKGLAIGVAEGVIVYKLTFPVHGPLLLYLIAQGFMMRQAV
ncbi:unnamed protein product, partial [Prorocentrum cordatum]